MPRRWFSNAFLLTYLFYMVTGSYQISKCADPMKECDQLNKTKQQKQTLFTQSWSEPADSSRKLLTTEEQQMYLLSWQLSTCLTASRFEEIFYSTTVQAHSNWEC